VKCKRTAGEGRRGKNLSVILKRSVQNLYANTCNILKCIPNIGDSGCLAIIVSHSGAG
jgi:hypothetical protein